jgi:hypothetical protein
VKKEQVPAGNLPTPEWVRAVRDNVEIITGKRDNKLKVPTLQVLTFSSTPTQAQMQSLNAYFNAWATQVEALVERLDDVDESPQATSSVVSASIGVSGALNSFSLNSLSLNGGRRAIVNSVLSLAVSKVQSKNPGGSVKKKQVPAVDTATPEFVGAVRDNIEIITGRRRNKLSVPGIQTLPFSATPLQSECQAFNSYVNAWGNLMSAIAARLDG